MKKFVSALIGAAIILVPTGTGSPASAAEVTCGVASWRAWEKSGGWMLDRTVPPPGVKYEARRITARVAYSCADKTEYRFVALSPSPEFNYWKVFPSNVAGNPNDYISISTELRDEINSATWWEQGSTSTYCDAPHASTGPWDPTYCGGTIYGEISHASAQIFAGSAPRTDRLDLFPATITVTVPDPAPAPAPAPALPQPAPAPAPAPAPEAVPVLQQSVRAWTYSKARKIEADVDPNPGRYMVQLQVRKGGTWKRYGAPKWTKGTHAKFNPPRGTYRVQVLGWSKQVAYSDPVRIKS